MDFANVSRVVIPEGEVAVIERGGEVLWQKSRLPFAYQEVEYIESTYDQYIDTGYVPSTDTKVELYASGITDATFPTSSGGWFVGSRTAYQSEAFGTYYNPGEQGLYGAFGNQQSSVRLQKADFYNKDHVFIIDKSGLYLDGAKKISFNRSFDGKYPLYLFAINLAGALSTVIRFKMHYFKAWDNDAPIRDLVPCYRKADGKTGMYDLVTATFYTNAGSGEFVLGPEV